MLDLRGVASFADYFVIMSAESSRQIEALEEDITEGLKVAEVRRFHREGTRAHFRTRGAGVFRTGAALVQGSPSS